MNKTEVTHTRLSKMPESQSKMFRSELKLLPKMLAFVRTHAKRFGLAKKSIKQVELAAEEALVNIINYAYTDADTGNLKVSCLVMKGEKLLLEIEDQGQAYNPLEEPVESPKNLSLKERKVGGLGRFFILKLMDDVTYERRGESNILRLVKLHSS